MLSPKAQKVLVRAAELIGRPKGWIKHKLFGAKDTTSDNWYGVDFDRYCSMGALHRATGEICEGRVSGGQLETTEAKEVYIEASKALGKSIKASAPGIWGGGDIASWNDHPHRTHEEVKGVFCDAVKREVTGDGDEKDPETGKLEE